MNTGLTAHAYLEREALKRAHDILRGRWPDDPEVAMIRGKLVDLIADLDNWEQA